MKRQEIKKGEIVIYKSKEGPKLDVRLEKETVWLTQKQIAMLFDTQRPAITKHLNNIFRSGELNKNSVSSILEHTAADGKVYKTQFYNLDAIISVGYRVNSKRATQFRIWATKTLKEHLIKGYTIIASFLFIYFLDKNNFLYRHNGEKKINDNALTALALLVAVSNPRDKDVLIKIITNLIS